MWTDYTFFFRKKRGHGVMVQSRGSWRPWSGVHLLSLQQRGFVRQAPGMCASEASLAAINKVTTWEALFIPIKMVMTWWFIIGFTTCLYMFQVEYGWMPGKKTHQSVKWVEIAVQKLWILDSTCQGPRPIPGWSWTSKSWGTPQACLSRVYWTSYDIVHVLPGK
jgi:hypothetical protein